MEASLLLPTAVGNQPSLGLSPDGLHAAHFAEGVARQEEAREVAEWVVVPHDTTAGVGGVEGGEPGG